MLKRFNLQNLDSEMLVEEFCSKENGLSLFEYCLLFFGYFGKSVFTHRASMPYTMQIINVRGVVKEIDNCRK